MNDYIYCPHCECWIDDETANESEDGPRCPHCGGELQSYDPEPYHPVYDTLEEKYL